MLLNQITNFQAMTTEQILIEIRYQCFLPPPLKPKIYHQKTASFRATRTDMETGNLSILLSTWSSGKKHQIDFEIVSMQSRKTLKKIVREMGKDPRKNVFLLLGSVICINYMTRKLSIEIKRLLREFMPAKAKKSKENNTQENETRKKGRFKGKKINIGILTSEENLKKKMNGTLKSRFALNIKQRNNLSPPDSPILNNRQNILVPMSNKMSQIFEFNVRDFLNEELEGPGEYLLEEFSGDKFASQSSSLSSESDSFMAKMLFDNQESFTFPVVRGPTTQGTQFTQNVNEEFGRLMGLNELERMREWERIHAVDSEDEETREEEDSKRLHRPKKIRSDKEYVYKTPQKPWFIENYSWFFEDSLSVTKKFGAKIEEKRVTGKSFENTWDSIGKYGPIENETLAKFCEEICNNMDIENDLARALIRTNDLKNEVKKKKEKQTKPFGNEKMLRGGFGLDENFENNQEIGDLFGMEVVPRSQEMEGDSGNLNQLEFAEEPETVDYFERMNTHFLDSQNSFDFVVPNQSYEDLTLDEFQNAKKKEAEKQLLMQEIKEEFKMGRQINLNQFIEENHGESSLEKVTAFSSFLELAQEGVVILNQKEPKIRWVHCEIQASRGASFY